MDLDHPKSKWIQPTLDLIGWMLFAPGHSLHEIQTHWIGLDRKSWISKYPLDLSPLLLVPLPGGRQHLHRGISSFQQLLVASSSGCRLLRRCLPPNKCVVMCFSSLPDHVCVPWPPLLRTASTRSGLNRRWLVAPGAVGLRWRSEDRLVLEHHLVRLREHRGEHVHDGVPLLLCLRPWRCQTKVSDAGKLERAAETVSTSGTEVFGR